MINDNDDDDVYYYYHTTRPLEATTPPPLMSEGRDDKPPVSPLRQANPEPFQKYIKRLLQRNHSNPILK